MATDWIAAQAEYVGGSVTLAELAAKYGVTLVAAKKRSSRGQWTELRRRAQTALAAQITRDHHAERATAIVEWDQRDLTIAKALRSRVARELARLPDSGRINLDSLRTLAATAETVQRIGRLALGATTDNQGVSNPNGTPLENPPTLADWFATVQAVQIRFRRETDEVGR